MAMKAGNDTGIQWTWRPGSKGCTWNPLRGCSRESPGCTNCYAEDRAYRILQQQHGLVKLGKKFQHALAYDGTVRLSKGGDPRWTGEIQLAPHKLDEPLRWKAPRTVFTNSMSDLFHPNVPFEYVAAVCGVMAAAEQHVFQVLTKRPARLAEFTREWLPKMAMEQRGIVRAPCEFETLLRYAFDALPLTEVQKKRLLDPAWARMREVQASDDYRSLWPLKNVWFGTTIESNDYRASRLAALGEAANAMPWVSQEPQIGEVTYTAEELSWLKWIVIGGESGAKDKVRPFNLDWARKTVAQCADAGVACFVKQMGTIPYQDEDFPDGTKHVGVKLIDGVEKPGLCFGNKKGGDPEEWPEEFDVRQWPEAA